MWRTRRAQQRKTDLGLRCSALFFAIEGFEFVNNCHSPETGEFCGESGGGREHGLPAKEQSVLRGISDSGVRARLTSLLHDRRAAEPLVTKDLSGLASAGGGVMVGLGHKFKEASGVAGKVDRKVKEKGITAAAAAEGIGDSLRYTMNFPAGSYTAGMKAAVLGLVKQGYKFDDFETNWQKGDAYNGINAVVRHPKYPGLKIELQFHTPGSFHVKDALIHKDYEFVREMKGTREDRIAAVERMRDLSDAIEFPSGVHPLPPTIAGVKVTNVFRHPKETLSLKSVLGLSTGDWRARFAAGGGNPYHLPAGEGGGRFTTAEAVGKRLASAKPTSKGVKSAGAAYRAGEGPRMSLDLIPDSKRKAVIDRQKEVPGFEDIRAGGTPKSRASALEEIISRQSDNIFEYADHVLGASRLKADATADWYPWANKFFTDLGKKNGIEPVAAIAATAALSASAAWESNVPWSKFLVENMATNAGPGKGIHQKVDPTWVTAQYTAALSSYNVSLKEGKTPKKKPDASEYVGLIGKELGSLSDKEIAIALRGKHESGGTGKGAEGKLVRQLGEEVHAGLGKKGGGTIPQTAENIAKAVSVIRNPSAENIDKNIGNQNKVRSFFQNMRDPLDTVYSDITADTHHFGIANGMPWTTSSRFIKGNKEVVSSPGNADTGALGTYPLVVEATRRATDRINTAYGTHYTPNQIQSIVWEFHKDIYKPKTRANAAMQKSVELARTEFAAGKISKLERDARIEAARVDGGNKTLAEILKEYREFKG